MTIDLQTLIQSVAVIFMYIAIGYTAKKIGFMDDIATGKLTSFVLSVAQPFMIVNAVISTEYSAENLKSGGTILLVGFTVHILAAIVAFLATRWIKEPGVQRVTEISMIFANCGFIGFPLVEALYGRIGLFWGAFYVITFNMVCWTYGLYILSRAKKDIKINPLKMILNFGTVPCIVGIIIFLFRIPLPGVVLQAFSGVSGICTPLTMIVAGALIARIPFRRLFTDLRVYFSNAVRLLVMPILAALVLKLLGFSGEFAAFGALMAGLPTGAVVAMFAEKNGVESDLAAHIVGMSTLLNVGTLPLAMWVVGKIL